MEVRVAECRNSFLTPVEAYQITREGAYIHPTTCASNGHRSRYRLDLKHGDKSPPTVYFFSPWPEHNYSL